MEQTCKGVPPTYRWERGAWREVIVWRERCQTVAFQELPQPRGGYSQGFGQVHSVRVGPCKVDLRARILWGKPEAK